ncbi:MAG TPA: UvrD-helicase domain-containing protein [bacterium]|nr:UvrD-helicase domain-containing protein [bacterium]
MTSGRSFLSGLRLSDTQREAVTATDGPLLVFAGAGSGKTRVITCRIAYLLGEKRIAPEEILAVTFTNKAAREMKERVASIVNDPSVTRRLTVCTFHSLGLQILKREHTVIGYPAHFVVFSPYEQVELMKKVMEEERISREQYSPYSVMAVVSRLKNDPDLFNDQRFYLGNIRHGVARRLCEPYQRALKAAAAMDFDDLIMKPLELFEQNEEIRKRYAAKWRYLMVDEYQDTNRAQYRLIRELSSVHGNVCVVGDDDQSIYSWRGARVENILEFEQDFPGTRVVKLEENYRSVAEIVETAGRLIGFNRTRAEKKVFARRRAEEEKPITIHTVMDEAEEADRVAREIVSLSAGGLRYTDLAVMVRTNAQTLPFEKAFARQRIPYRVIGGQKFFENKEIKDLVAYLRILVRPDDEISLRRIINYPTRGIGTVAVEKLFEIAAVERSPALSVAERIGEYALLSPAQRDAIAKFSTLYRGLVDEMACREPVPFAEHLIRTIGIEEAIHRSGESDESVAIRLENIREFVSAVSYHHAERPAEVPREFWLDLINAVALIQSGDENDKKKGVNIITAHSAKGLEFEVVFVPGFYQGGMPNRLALEEGNIEEERRLCYVAFTRARRRLFITIPRMIKVRGRTMPTTVSVFLSEAGLSTMSAAERREMAENYLQRIREKIEQDRPEE